MEFNPKTCEVDTGKLEGVAEDLLGMVSRISGKTGDMEAHFNNSAKEFSELVAEDIYSVANENIGAWGDALSACFHVFGIVKKWKGEVEEYEENIELLQQEWNEAIQSNFGFSDPDDAGIVEAMRLKAESLQTRADNYWDTLEGQADDNTGSLESGPTVANLRELVDAGVLGFAFYNATRQVMYYPSTAGNGENHAEELQDYINGDKEPDANYYHLIGQLAAINAFALEGQKNGEKLRPDQIEYLEEFYSALEENGTVVNLSEVLDENEAFEEGELEELREALAGGLLALSDGDLGGGYEHLPEDVRNVTEGQEGWERPHNYGPGISEGQKEDLDKEAWVDAASNLGDLLQAAPSQQDGQPMHGGSAFSAHLTFSITQALEAEYPDSHHADPDFVPLDELQPLLDVSTRSPEGNAILLTGDPSATVNWGSEDESNYIHPGHGEVETRDILSTLYQQDWDDGGATVAQITDWIPEYANSGDTNMEILAGTSSAGLVEAITDDNDLYLDLIGVEFYEEIEDEDRNNLGEVKKSFTEENPALAESFFGVFHSYIEDFGGEVDSGEHEYNSHHDLNLDPQSRARFMQYIAGDDEAAIKMIASVDAQRMDNLSFENIDPNSPEVAGSQNGTLQGLLDTALQNEAMNRTANEDEAEIENVKRRREAATMVSDMVLAAAKVPAGENPVTSLGADMLETIIKEEVKNRVEQNIEEDIGDLEEPKGDTHTPEHEARRDASLFIIKQLVEGEGSDLDIGDLKEDERKSLTLAGKGEDEHVATGINEVYSRDRSQLDSGMRDILEAKEIPPGSGNQVPADEFMEFYTRNHREQYDDIVGNLRVDRPEDIAELAGRSI